MGELTSRLSASRLTNDNRDLIPLDAVEELLAVLENGKASSLRFEGEIMPWRTRDGRATFLGRAIE